MNLMTTSKRFAMSRGRWHQQWVWGAAEKTLSMNTYRSKAMEEAWGLSWNIAWWCHMGLKRRGRGVLGVTYVYLLFISLENQKQQVNGSDEGLDHWIALFFLLFNKEIGEECFSTGSHLYDGLGSQGGNLVFWSLLPSISMSCTTNLTVFLAITVC